MAKIKRQRDEIKSLNQCYYGFGWEVCVCVCACLGVGSVLTFIPKVLQPFFLEL